MAILSAKTTLSDRSPSSCPLAASHNANKIGRADYGVKFYMSLALRSQNEWLTFPLYCHCHHQSGMTNTEGTGLGRCTIQNFEDLDAKSQVAVIEPGKLKLRYQSF